jgi:hypothetical protein
MSHPVDLAVLSLNQNSARCRVLATDELVTLRAKPRIAAVPGEIVTVTPQKRWTHRGGPCLSGAIENVRLDARALGLAPLELEQMNL